MPKVYGHRPCKSLVEVAKKDHTHSADQVGAAAKKHTHTPAEVGIIISATEPANPVEGTIWLKIEEA